MKSLLLGFINNGNKFKYSDVELSRLKLINSIILIELILIFPFWLFDIYKGNIFSAVLEFFNLFIFVLLWVKLRTSRGLELIASVIVSLAGATALLFWLASPDNASGRFLTLLIIPVLSGFLLGKKKGTAFSITFAIIFGSFFLANFYTNPTYQDHLPSFLSGAFAYLTLGFFVYLNEGLIEGRENIIHQRDEDIKRKNEELSAEIIEKQKEVASRIKAEESSHKQNEELSRMNRMMIDRELKMVEMKTEIDSLTQRLSKYEKTI